MRRIDHQPVINSAILLPESGLRAVDDRIEQAWETCLQIVAPQFDQPVAAGSWDPRWVLGGGAALFVLGMIGQAAAQDFSMMAAARIVAAIGGAVLDSSGASRLPWTSAAVGFLPRDRCRHLAPTVRTETAVVAPA